MFAGIKMFYESQFKSGQSSCDYEFRCYFQEMDRYMSNSRAASNGSLFLNGVSLLPVLEFPAFMLIS